MGILEQRRIVPGQFYIIALLRCLRTHRPGVKLYILDGSLGTSRSDACTARSFYLLTGTDLTHSFVNSRL